MDDHNNNKPIGYAFTSDNELNNNFRKELPLDGFVIVNMKDNTNKYAYVTKITTDDLNTIDTSKTYVYVDDKKPSYIECTISKNNSNELIVNIPKIGWTSAENLPLISVSNQIYNFDDPSSITQESKNRGGGKSIQRKLRGTRRKSRNIRKK